MSTRHTPGAFLTTLEALLEGLRTKLPAGNTQLTAEGKTSSLSELQAEVQGYVTAYRAVEQAVVTHATLLQARRALEPQAHARYAALSLALKAAMGRRNPYLAEYGVAPEKAPAPRTSEQDQVRIAKAHATRLARGTKGKRQRAAIKGRCPERDASSASAPSPTAPRLAVLRTPRHTSGMDNMDQYTCLRCNPDARGDGLPPPPDQIWVYGPLPEKVTEVLAHGHRAKNVEASAEMHAWFKERAFDGKKNYDTLQACLKAHHLNYWELYPTTI